MSISTAGRLRVSLPAARTAWGVGTRAGRRADASAPAACGPCDLRIHGEFGTPPDARFSISRGPTRRPDHPDSPKFALPLAAFGTIAFITPALRVARSHRRRRDRFDSLRSARLRAVEFTRLRKGTSRLVADESARRRLGSTLANLLPLRCRAQRRDGFRGGEKQERRRCDITLPEAFRSAVW